MIRAGSVSGVDPAREELAARQAADETARIRMQALENVARDGFPQMGGQTVDALVDEGLLRRQSGRVPYALTLAGVDAILEHRRANR